MKLARPLAIATLGLALAAASAVPHAQHAGGKVDPWVLGARVALRAYTKASDAYTANVVSSVALWALVLAAALVLLEWLLGRGRGGPRA